MSTKISAEMEGNKTLDMTFYEIKIDDYFFDKEDTNELVQNFLYECQCALFLIDLTNEKSFELMKKLINLINMDKLPYLTRILVSNKTDLPEKKITSFQIKEYLDSNQKLDSLEISIKNCGNDNNSNNLVELKKKINTAINGTKNEIPANILSESATNKAGIINIQGTLSFILLGDTTVGKTCFLTRYFKNQFIEVFLSTIGVDKEIKHVKLRNDTYKVTLWDTAGQERFKMTLPKKYYQNADAVLLLFDVTNEDSFKNVSKWMKDAKENSGKSGDDLTIYLIGNKIDLPGRVVTREDAEAMAKSLGLKYFEVSCKINMNITEVMSRLIMDCYMKANNIDNCFTLSADNAKNKAKKGGCCKN